MNNRRQCNATLKETNYELARLASRLDLRFARSRLLHLPVGIWQHSLHRSLCHVCGHGHELSLLFRYQRNSSGRTGRPRSLILLMSRANAYSRSGRPINIFGPRSRSHEANRKPCVVSGIIYDRTYHITSARSDSLRRTKIFFEESFGPWLGLAGCSKSVDPRISVSAYCAVGPRSALQYQKLSRINRPATGQVGGLLQRMLRTSLSGPFGKLGSPAGGFNGLSSGIWLNL